MMASTLAPSIATAQLLPAGMKSVMPFAFAPPPALMQNAMAAVRTFTWTSRTCTSVPPVCGVQIEMSSPRTAS